jgi:hypothetical protein
MTEHVPSRGNTIYPTGSESTSDEVVKVAWGIGKDTSDRIDMMMTRGGFGGRARAVDALMEALNDVNSPVQKWWEAFNAWTNAKAGSAEQEQAEALMLMGAAMVFTRLSKFIGAYPQEGLKGPPP